MSFRASKPSVFLCLTLLSFPLLSARYRSKHSAWVIVSNSNMDGKPVDMKIIVTDKKESSTVIADQPISIGLQKLPEKKLSEGTYQLSVTAHNNEVGTTQPITVSAECWIIINYVQADSATIVKNEGYLDPNLYKKVNGKYATISVSVNNRRPANL